MASRGALLLLRRDMSMTTRTVGLPTEAIGRVRPRGLPKHRGGPRPVRPSSLNTCTTGASSAARARLAQVLSTVKEQAAKPAYNQSSQTLPEAPQAASIEPQSDNGCPSCGATHASDAPHVHKSPGEKSIGARGANNGLAEPVVTPLKHQQAAQAAGSDGEKARASRSRAAEKIAMAAKANAPLSKQHDSCECLHVCAPVIFLAQS